MYKIKRSAYLLIAPVRFIPVLIKTNLLFLKYRKYTMVPKSLFIQNLMLSKQFKKVNGCIVECGVWKGGMVAGIAEFISNKKAYLFDSYEGLPSVEYIDGEKAEQWQNNPEGKYYYDNCSADEKFALEAMSLSGVEFQSIKGWFRESLELVSIPAIAILRLDGDWYDSTMDCLNVLFPKVSYGGIIIVDDYLVWEGCSKAVHDYLSKIKSKSRIQSKGSVTYIVKVDKQ